MLLASNETLEKYYILKMWHVMEEVKFFFPSNRFFIHFYRDVNSLEN